MPAGDTFDSDDTWRRLDRAIDREAATLLDVHLSPDFRAHVQASLASPGRSRRSLPERRLAVAGAVCVLVLAAVLWHVRAPRPDDRGARLVARGGAAHESRPVAPLGGAGPTPGDAVRPASDAPSRRPPGGVSMAEAEEGVPDEAGAGDAPSPADRWQVPGVLVEPLLVERVLVPSVAVERIGGRDDGGMTGR